MQDMAPAAGGREAWVWPGGPVASFHWGAQGTFTALTQSLPITPFSSSLPLPLSWSPNSILNSSHSYPEKSWLTDDLHVTTSSSPCILQSRAQSTPCWRSWGWRKEPVFQKYFELFSKEFLSLLSHQQVCENLVHYNYHDNVRFLWSFFQPHNSTVRKKFLLCKIPVTWHNINHLSHFKCVVQWH